VVSPLVHVIQDLRIFNVHNLILISFFVAYRLNKREDQRTKLSSNQNFHISETVVPSEDDKNVSASHTVC